MKYANLPRLNKTLDDIPWGESYAEEMFDRLYYFPAEGTDPFKIP